jgi:hypothetical protein
MHPVLAFADPSGWTVEGIRGREQAPTTFGTRRQLLLAKKLFKADYLRQAINGYFVYKRQRVWRLRFMNSRTSRSIQEPGI